MSEIVVTEAKSDALGWQAAARNRVGEPAPTPEALAQERLAGLAASCPAAGVAAAVVAVNGWPVQPLDPDTLDPSGAPLDTAGEVWAHFRHRRDDAVGLALGQMPGGVTLVAQYATARAWQQWQKVAGAEVHRRVDDYGNAVEVASPLPMPRAVSLTWQPPAASLRSSGVHVGSAAIEAAGRALGPDATPAEPGWLLYAVDPVDGRPVIFRNRKAKHDVSVVASGTVPLCARRADGATLVASGTPYADAMPEWLVAALGGRLGTATSSSTRAGTTSAHDPRRSMRRQ